MHGSSSSPRTVVVARHISEEFRSPTSLRSRGSVVRENECSEVVAYFFIAMAVEITFVYAIPS